MFPTEYCLQHLWRSYTDTRSFYKQHFYKQHPLHKKWSFLLRISSVNVTKSAGKCGFGHIYWKNSQWKTSFFVQWSDWNLQKIKQELSNTLRLNYGYLKIIHFLHPRYHPQIIDLGQDMNTNIININCVSG